MSLVTARRFLDLRALAALSRLRFAPRHRIEGSYSGKHQSHAQGGAGEFVDYREYVAGEDLRRLDWKVLARTGRAYVRLHQEETNLVCTLVLDASASMRFGDAPGAHGKGTKLEYVQFLASALCHLIGRQQDQAGLAVVADGLTEFLPPGGTPSHVARLLDAIEGLETAPVTRLGKGLRDLYERLSQRGVLVVMSDFLVDDLDDVFGAVRSFRHRQFEVILLQIIHPDEERLPEGTAYRFVGLENDGSVDASPREIRQLYQERFEAHVAAVRLMALSTGCDHRRISTALSYLQTLGKFLVERLG
ncbi:MAG: DUF58 domain-containing protein [Isosphaerales bacterium]